VTAAERRSIKHGELEMEVACERVESLYAKAVAHWDLYAMASLGPQLSVLQRIVREHRATRRELGLAA
jgi:hypothetical protein